MIFLFLIFSNCLIHDLFFNFGQKETFHEILEDDDTQLTIELNVTTPEGAPLKYRLNGPNESNTTYLEVPKKMEPLILRGKGVYSLDVINFHSKPVLFRITSFIDKGHEPDENALYIRNILNKLKNDLQNLYTGTMQLSEDKRIILRQAISSQKKLIWLCLLPGGYLIVGIVKYKIMKGMFMPKK